MIASIPSKSNLWVLISTGIVLAVVTVLTYLPTRQHDFLNWDDQSYVVDNDHVKGGLTQEGFVWAVTQSHSANWHPVTWLSHTLDCQVFGMQPGGHHITNVVFHSINAALVFLLLHALTGSRWRSALVAGIFALHPLRVESVAWVSERKDMLSLFFGLLALITYARHVTASVSQRPKAKVWYLSTLIFFALGLMSKPMLVTWPFVMLLLDVWPLNRVGLESRVSGLGSWDVWKKLLLEKAPFFALAVGSCIVTVIAQKQGKAVASFEHLPISYRLQNASVAYVEYLSKLFWPAKLSPIYPHPAHWELWRVAGSITILVMLSALVWRYRKHFPCGVTGWFWFLGTLVPVIGIVQVGTQAFADRYTYVPQIGLVMLLVWLAAEVVVKLRLPKMISGGLAAALLATLAWRTTEQLAYWKNTETLFRRTLELSPKNTQALNGLGGHYIKVGRIEEGKQLLEQVIRLEPTFVEARGTLAEALDDEGHYQDAVQQYEAALAIQSDNASILNNLAWLRAACPDATIRNGKESVEFAIRACELTGYSKPLFIGTLAAAQAEVGDFQSAIMTAEKAAALSTRLRLEQIASRNRELIDLYRQGKAAHGRSPKAK